MSEETFGKILLALCIVLFVAWRLSERSFAKMNAQHPEHDNGSCADGETRIAHDGPLPQHLAAVENPAHVRGKGNHCMEREAATPQGNSESASQADGYFDAGDGE